MKFFKFGKKGNSGSSVDVGISGSAQDISTGSNLEGHLQTSSLSLNENATSSSYSYAIKDKELKDIFSAVWTGDYVKTRNILAKNKTKINARDSENRTPLHLACVKERPPILQLLLRSDPKMDLKDKDGATPLIKGVQLHHEHCTRMLLKSKANANIHDNSGMTCLHYAVRDSWKEGVKSLLEQEDDVDIDITDSNGNTALHLACENKDRLMSSMLVTNRAKTNVHNNFGKTPLIIAAENGCREIVELLIEGGNADLTLKDSEGWTAYDRAEMNAFTDIKKYLALKEKELENSEAVVQRVQSSTSEDGNHPKECEKEDRQIVVKTGGNDNTGVPTKETFSHHNADDSWFGSDSESLPVLKNGAKVPNKPIVSNLSPKRDGEGAVGIKEEIEGPSDDVGSFMDDESSLSLAKGFGKQKSTDNKKKKVIERMKNNSDFEEDFDTDVDEIEEKNPLKTVEFGSQDNNKDAHPSKPNEEQRRGHGNKLGDLIDDDSHWESDTENLHNVDSNINDIKQTNSEFDLVDIPTTAAVASKESKLHSEPALNISENISAAKEKEDPKSSYWDSSEEEVEAENELKQQKQKEGKGFGGGSLSKDDFDVSNDDVEDFDSEVGGTSQTGHAGNSLAKTPFLMYAVKEEKAEEEEPEEEWDSDVSQGHANQHEDIHQLDGSDNWDKDRKYSLGLSTNLHGKTSPPPTDQKLHANDPLEVAKKTSNEGKRVHKNSFDSDSETEKTETISSWEISNQNRKQLKASKLLNLQEKEIETEEIDNKNDVLIDDSPIVQEKQNAVESNVTGIFPDSFNESFDTTKSEINEEAETVLPNHGIDLQSKLVIPSGGGDRVPSNPVPSRDVGPMSNDQKTKLKRQPMTSQQFDDVVDQSKAAEENNEFKNENDDFNSSSDSMEQPTVSVNVGFSPRLIDLKKNVNSSGGLVAIKNQFRDQSRVLAKEQSEKQHIEKKVHAFESEIDQLSRKIQNLQKDKEVSEEVELDLRNKLKSLQQDLSQEIENRQLSEQILSQRGHQLEKLEEELNREISAREDAERKLRNMQMQLNEANSKLKNNDHLTLISGRARSRTGNNSLAATSASINQSQADDTIINQSHSILVEEEPIGSLQQQNNHPLLSSITRQSTTKHNSAGLDEERTKNLELSNQILNLETKLNGLNEEREKLKREVEDAKAEHQRLSRSLEAETKKSLDREVIQQKLDLLNEQLAAKSEVVSKLETELATKNSQIENLQNKIHQCELDNTRLASDLKHAEEVLVRERDKFENSLNQIKTEKVELQQQIKEQTAQFNKFEHSVRGESEKLNSDLNRTVSDYKRDLAVAEARLKANDETKKMNEIEADALKKELEHLKTQLDQLNKKNAETEVKNSELTIKVSMLERAKESQPSIEDKVRPSKEKSSNQLQNAGEKKSYPNSKFEEEIILGDNESNMVQAERPSNFLLDGLENEIEQEREKRKLSQRPVNNQYRNYQPVNNNGPANQNPNSPSNAWGDLEQYKKEIEARCLMEFNEKMKQVKNHLDEQSSWLNNLEKDRSDKENMLKREYNRRITDLELDIRKYKELYGVTIPVRDNQYSFTSMGGGGAMGVGGGEDPELKRLYALLEKERRQREKLEYRLEKLVDRDIDSRAMLLAEQHRQSDLSMTAPIGGYSTLGGGGTIKSTPGSTYKYRDTKSGYPKSEFDALLERVRQQLDSSISRHLGTTKMELELFSQHPYATWDKSNSSSRSRMYNNSNYKMAADKL